MASKAKPEADRPARMRAAENLAADGELGRIKECHM